MAASDTEVQNKLEDDLGIPIALRKGVRSCTKHSISNYLRYSRLSPQYQSFIVSLDNVAIPRDIYQALQDEKWKAATLKEMKALEKNDTCEIMELPEGKKAVGSKWVFTMKYKSDGSINRYKA